MKKTIYFILTVALCFSAQTTHSNSESYSSSFGTPQLVDYLNFSATLQANGNVETDWDAYTGDLMYYKVSRSQTNPSPVYPDDGYIFYSDSATSYTDTKVPTGKNYYRVCAITSNKDRYCSNVVTIETAEDTPICTQVITPAEKDGQCKEYATPCDVPEGWIKVDSCEVIAPDKIELKVELKNEKPYLTWSLDTNSPKGYKVAISKTNPEPTYPVMKGDSYVYISNGNTKSFEHINAKAETKYFYRICFYEGNGKCGVYSNPVSITTGAENTIEMTKQEENKVTLFKDVPAGVWFEGYLNDFVKRGIIDGYADGSFQPSRTVNRAEMAKMIVKALGVEPQTTDMNIFCDVSPTDWFHSYVTHLYFANVIEGFVGGDCDANRVYKPAQAVSRAEAVKIILSMYDASVEPLSTEDQTGFSDVNANHWASAYIRTAFKLGIVKGYDDGTFNPEAKLSRAEFVKMLSEAETVLK